ncbi:MAG: hypothetical protein AAGD01_18715 [Acidobacteriota bacterium]
MKLQQNQHVVPQVSRPQVGWSPLGQPRTMGQLSRQARPLKLLGILLLQALFMLPSAAAPAAEKALEATPNTGIGPHYPVPSSREADSDLTSQEGIEAIAEGRPLRLRAKVRGDRGEVVAGARIVLWQTDAWGKYDHPRADRSDAEGNPVALDPGFQYSGRTLSDESGGFEFLTIVPGAYEGRPAHLHLTIHAEGYRPVATEIHFVGDPAAEDDYITTAAQRALITKRLEQDPQRPDGLLVVHQIVLTPKAP